MKKGKAYKFADLASHLTGLSIPVFGVSWTAPESQLFGTHLAFLSACFGIDLEPDLASIVPDYFKEDDDSDQLGRRRQKHLP